MSSIPDSHHDLFEKQSFAHIATMTPEGFPHVTPVWVDYDAERDLVLINTVRGRQKEWNMAENPHVGVSMLDPEDPYRYCSVTGEVSTITEEGAVAHIDELAGRYMGLDEYPNHDTDRGPRVIVEIRPIDVLTS